MDEIGEVQKLKDVLSDLLHNLTVHEGVFA